MPFDPDRPITAANCPTRAALERPANLTQSINARHTEKQRAQHTANAQARALAQSSGK